MAYFISFFFNEYWYVVPNIKKNKNNCSYNIQVENKNYLSLTDI